MAEEKNNTKIDVVCPSCGYTYRHDTNIFGKVCTHCQTTMDSDAGVFEFECQRKSKEQKELLQQKAREQIRRKLFSIGGKE